MTWRPILTEQDGEAARRIVVDVADALAQRKAAPDPFEALLDAYLAKAFGSERHADRALHTLEDLFNHVHSHGPALYGGLAGLGWVVMHIRRLLADWLEPDDDPCSDIDDALLSAVRRYPQPGHYDLISGLAGIAVYAFERMPDAKARELLGAIVDRLAATAERRDGGISWLTDVSLMPVSQRSMAGGYYNLGLAHGVPAVALLLARAVSADVRADVSRGLLEPLLTWIVNQRSDVGAGSRFPPWVPHEGPPLSGSREAWCYGGLGLSVALLGAAASNSSGEWEQTVLGFARLEASRGLDESEVMDMCLCHGGAGNGHLYNRLHQHTGESIFLDAARKWLRVTVSARTPEVDLGGYRFQRAVDPDDPGTQLVMEPSGSFLNGVLGVALSLLAASTDLEPCWDRLLMADLPPRAV